MGGRVSRRRTSSEDCSGKPEKVKIVVLGAAGVGKTTFFRRLMGDLAQGSDEQYVPSTKANIGAKLMQLDGLPSVVIEVWDVPFQLFGGRTMLERYVAGAKGIVLLYSLSNEQLEPSSRVALEFLRGRQEIEKKDSGVEIAVVGNKRDLLSEAHGLVAAPDSSYTELRHLCEQLSVTHTEILTRASAVEVVLVVTNMLHQVLASK